MAHIIGKNIVLREFKKEDLPHMREWVNDHDITKYLSDIFLYPSTLNSTEGFLNFCLEGNSNSKHFVVADKNTLDYIGQIGIESIDWKNNLGTLGIVLGKKDKLEKGIGTEAIELLQFLAFYRMNLNKIELDVHDFNIRAIKTYEKLGFVLEGTIRQRFYYNGEYRNSLKYGILKDEYLQRSSELKNFIVSIN